MILIDTNILIDIMARKQHWRDWSISQLSVLAADHRLTVNQVVCAEVAPKLGSMRAFETWLAAFAINLDCFGSDSAFAAGTAFDQYRARRRLGEINRGTVLADFFIGGHAHTSGASVLTRDPRFFRAYFPTVPLITPDRAEP